MTAIQKKGWCGGSGGDDDDDDDDDDGGHRSTSQIMTTFQATVVTTLYPSFFNVMDNVERDDNDNNLECFQNDPLHLHLHPT